MTLHLKGRPCRETTGGFESDTTDWRRVTCHGCRGSKKYKRLSDAGQPKVRRGS